MCFDTAPRQKLNGFIYGGGCCVDRKRYRPAQEGGQAPFGNGASPLTLSVIDVLEINPEVLALEQGNCGLQLVLALALHPHLIALDLRLDFQLAVLDDPRDVLRLLARE